MSSPWQPIETAPKDGTEIILASWGAATNGDLFPWWLEESLWKSALELNGKHYQEGWHLTAERAKAHYGSFPATHWMPLLTPSPTPLQTGGK